MIELSTEQQEAFWVRVHRGDENECWPFLRRNGETYQGYGQFYQNGVVSCAHRVALFLATGTDPADLLVRHTCDNPPCCNPRHLLLGTHEDNARDRVERGRIRVKNTRHFVVQTIRLTIKEADRLYRVVALTKIPQSALIRDGLAMILTEKEREIALRETPVEPPQPAGSPPGQH